MKTNSPDTTRHCAYCGHTITGEAKAPERFGERFCSEAHAEEFVTGVRAVRMEAIARADETERRDATKGGDACALASPAERGWSANTNSSAGSCRSKRRQLPTSSKPSTKRFVTASCA